MPSQLPRVTARVSPAARRRIEAAAAKAGLRVGRWARRVLLRASEDETSQAAHGHRMLKLVVNLDDGSVVIGETDPR